MTTDSQSKDCHLRLTRIDTGLGAPFTLTPSRRHRDPDESGFAFESELIAARPGSRLGLDPTTVLFTQNTAIMSMLL
jgi:hypothetical protein